MHDREPSPFGARRGSLENAGLRRTRFGLLEPLFARVAHAVTAAPQVDLARHLLIVGRKTIAFDQIDTAVLEVDHSLTGRILDLRFGVAHGPQVVVRLREGDALAATPASRGALLAILTESNIVMPSTSYDPTGHFARWNFPNNLNKAQAIEFVTNPPGQRDVLPIPN